MVITRIELLTKWLTILIEKVCSASAVPFAVLLIKEKNIPYIK